jgi:hypothetical protein
MAASESVTALVDELIALFNRRSMDLPDGYFTRHTQFRLNGVPFEEMLGRSPQDPLVLMITRGAAGYRFTAKAVQHAIPDAQLTRGDLDERDADDRRLVTGQCWMSGHYRGSVEAAELLVDVDLCLAGATLAYANVRVDPALLARVQQARSIPE